MVQEYFVDNELSKNLAIQSVLLKFEIEIIYLGIRGLLLFLVKLFKEWMLESLLSTESLSRIIAKKPAEQVQGILLNAWEESIKSDSLRFAGALMKEVANTNVLNLVHQVLRWQTKKSDEALDLLCQVFLPKENLSEVKLGEDTASGPHVDLRGVVLVLVLEEKLGSTEPPGHNIGSKIISGIDLLILDCGEAEIADLELIFVIH